MSASANPPPNGTAAPPAAELPAAAAAAAAAAPAADAPEVVAANEAPVAEAAAAPAPDVEKPTANGPAENGSSLKRKPVPSAAAPADPPTTAVTPASPTAEDAPPVAPLAIETKADAAAAAPVSTVAAAPAAAAAPVKNDGIDDVNPQDFKGDVQTSNNLPSAETLRKIENYQVLDEHGKSHKFKSLYTGRNVARRVLVIFVRHFFCGNCQDYLRSLSASITPEALLQLNPPTFIAVVGCGDPGLIGMYRKETACKFPIYSDPTRRLYDELGMIMTLSLGQRPAYMTKSLLASSISSVVQGLKQIGTGLVTKAGDQRQVGGEFLFEPLSVLTPLGDDVDKRIGEHIDFHSRQNSLKPAAAPTTTTEAAATGSVSSGGEEDDDAGTVEEKRVTWCHRMRNTRDHAEVPELMAVLGLDGEGRPLHKDMKRWSRALETRKGTGLSMASQMSAMKAEAEAARASADETPPPPPAPAVPAIAEEVATPPAAKPAVAAA